MSLSLSPTLEMHKHHAQDTEASMYVAFNKDGCCPKHPDILLRQKKLLGGWKVLLPECSRCAIEWRAKQEDSQSRLDEVYSSIRQLQDDERKKAEMHLRQMSDLDGNKEAQVEVLQNRVHELQEENQALLKDVGHLKNEIIASNLCHSEKVKALTEERNQLVKESEALVDSSFSSIQNAVSELSIRMDIMNQVLQSKQQDVGNMAITDTQDDTTTKCSSVKPNASSLLLPIEIKQCNLGLESAREAFIQAMDRDSEAKAKKDTEEIKLEELFHSMISDPSEVAMKIKKVKMDIIEFGTVSSPNFNALKDAMLEAKASADLLKGCKLRLKQLQAKHFVLHKQCDLSFSSMDTNFVAYTIRELKFVGYSINALTEVGYITSDLKDAGFTAKECKDAGYTIRELKDTGYTVMELMDTGYTAKEWKDAGYNAYLLKDADNNSAKKLKGAGFATNELKDAGFTTNELKGAGFTAMELRYTGFTVRELKDTYTGVDLYRAGYTIEQMKGFYHGGALRQFGYDFDELRRAGLIL